MEKFNYRSKPWLYKRSCRSLFFSFSLLLLLILVARDRNISRSQGGLPFTDSLQQLNTRSREERQDPDFGNGRQRDVKNASVLQRGIQLGPKPTIGLVNMDEKEALEWQGYADGQTPVQFPFARVNESLTWSDFFPEWIDEDGVFGKTQCPSMPLPSVDPRPELRLVIAKVPGCQSAPESGRERNVHRLQVLLAAAKVATASQAGENKEAMHVLIISECRPPLNLFPCRELVEHEGRMWLYLVNLAHMRTRLAMPVGSCHLALSLHHPDQPAVTGENISGDERSQAYVSMLHTDSSYVCGAIVLAHSIIRLTGSNRDLVMLVDKNIGPVQRRGLQAAGWKVREIERIRNPYAKKDSYNEWNYSKFRLWELTEYTKIVFIDADILVLRNLDFLFALPSLAAAGNDQDRFNSGLMVLTPSFCTFHTLLAQVHSTRSYNGGDQGFLNELFPWWHRLPKHLNFLKITMAATPESIQAKSQLFAADPPVLYAIHYLGLKPWLCWKDSDCNWNSLGRRIYASDAAHARWYRAHDSMALEMRRFCWMTAETKARRRAEAKKGRWVRRIQDPRMHHTLKLG